MARIRKYLRLEITIPREVDSALLTLAKSAGVSKRTVARQMLVAGLAPFDLISPAVIERMPVTLPAGPHSYAHKEKNHA